MKLHFLRNKFIILHINISICISVCHTNNILDLTFSPSRVRQSDGGDKDQDRLRRMREKGAKVRRRNERGDLSGYLPKAAQAHRHWLREPREGGGSCGSSHGKEGRDLAVRTVWCCGSPLRTGNLRQEGASWLCPEFAGSSRRASGEGELNRSPVHYCLQWWKSSSMCCYVMYDVCFSRSCGLVRKVEVRIFNLLSISRVVVCFIHHIIYIYRYVIVGFVCKIWSDSLGCGFVVSLIMYFNIWLCNEYLVMLKNIGFMILSLSLSLVSTSCYVAFCVWWNGDIIFWYIKS